MHARGYLLLLLVVVGVVSYLVVTVIDSTEEVQVASQAQSPDLTFGVKPTSLPTEIPTMIPESTVAPTATAVPTSFALPTVGPTTIPTTNIPTPTEVPSATPQPTVEATATPLPPTPTPTPDPTVPPVLKNLMVTFAPYDAGTGKGGAFLFDSSESMLFAPYGVTVQGQNGAKVLPTFEYVVEKNAPVYVVADGVVDSVTLNDNFADYEIMIQPIEGSYWQIWYDHVLNVTVSPGDTVVAGQQLGIAGIKDDTHSRTELMVRYSNWTVNETYTVCPFNVFDASLKSTYQAQVSQHMADWEAYKGDESIYDEAAQVAPGCIYSQIAE